MAKKPKAVSRAKRATKAKARHATSSAKLRKPAKRRIRPIPVGYHHVTAYLITRDGAASIAFYAKAFGGTERLRMPGPGGKIGHAEVKIGDSVIMLSDESPDWGTRSPLTLGGSPVHIMLYVKDVDATVARAIAAGAELTRPVETQFYGDRSGSLRDLDGHVWHVSTHVEDVPPKELRRRAEARAKAAEGAG